MGCALRDGGGAVGGALLKDGPVCGFRAKWMRGRTRAEVGVMFRSAERAAPRPEKEQRHLAGGWCRDARTDVVVWAATASVRKYVQEVDWL